MMLSSNHCLQRPPFLQYDLPRFESQSVIISSSSINSVVVVEVVVAGVIVFFVVGRGVGLIVVDCGNGALTATLVVLFSSSELLQHAAVDTLEIKISLQVTR
jgi:uncharacterized protein (DUF1786 family)